MGYDMDIIWIYYGYDMDIIWIYYGYDMDMTWAIEGLGVPGRSSPLKITDFCQESDSPEPGVSYWRSVSAAVTLLCLGFVAFAFYPHPSHFDLA